jgi:hypothetical protein
MTVVALCVIIVLMIPAVYMLYQLYAHDKFCESQGYDSSSWMKTWPRAPIEPGYIECRGYEYDKSHYGYPSRKIFKCPEGLKCR